MTESKDRTDLWAWKHPHQAVTYTPLQGISYSAAKLTNADGFIRHLPNGYQTVLTGDGANPIQGRGSFLRLRALLWQIRRF